MDKGNLCSLARSIVEAGDPLPQKLAIELIECVERSLPSAEIANRNLRWSIYVEDLRKEFGWSELKACEFLENGIVNYGSGDGDGVREAVKRSRRRQKEFFKGLAAIFEYHATGTCKMFQD